MAEGVAGRRFADPRSLHGCKHGALHKSRQRRHWGNNHCQPHSRAALRYFFSRAWGGVTPPRPSRQNVYDSNQKQWDSFSFTNEIKEDRTLQLPAGTPMGRVTVAITPAEEAAPTGRRLLAKLLENQAAFAVSEGLSQEQIDTALKRERASWR